MTEETKQQSPSERILSTRRNLLKKAGLGAGVLAASSTIAAPRVVAQTGPIKWRLQTYSGAPLGARTTLTSCQRLPR